MSNKKVSLLDALVTTFQCPILDEMKGHSIKSTVDPESVA
jgi:hypothetical protein